MAKYYLHFNRAKKHVRAGEIEEAKKDLLKTLKYDNPLYTKYTADFFRKGVVFDKNTTKALELYKKACDGGEKTACDAYELLLKG